MSRLVAMNEVFMTEFDQETSSTADLVDSFENKDVQEVGTLHGL